jgi:hypothetical protein
VAWQRLGARFKLEVYGQKNAIHKDGGVGRVFMVAGARFVQDPTIKAWV